FDPATDATALRRLALERAVKSEKRRAMAAAGETVGDVDAISVDATEYPKYLESAYARARFDKPKNAIGFTRELPPAEMEALILQNADAGEDALRELANARAQVVKAAIEKNGDIADARLFLLAPKEGVDGAKDGGKPNRV